AGLERPSDGTVTLDDDSFAGNGEFIGPEDRGVGIVFQNFALFPHLTVGENIAFGLTEADATESQARVDELLDLMDLNGMGDRTIDQLS
ncbi:ATP-binding cassette domain-containing protein, partial [Xanthomonas citri pv. citri]|nr:ATP-binding cassette domain-containing protein [Xanthomonas citri pv. citri]